MDYVEFFNLIWTNLYSFISSCFGFLIDLVFSLITLILLPIDNLILKNIPIISELFYYFNELINLLIDSCSWFFSWFGFTSEMYTIIIGYYTFKIYTSLAVHSVKTGIKWYRSIKVS